METTPNQVSVEAATAAAATAPGMSCTASSPNDSRSTSDPVAVDAAVADAFRTLIDVENELPRRATRLVTVALHFLSAALARRGSTVDDYLKESCPLDPQGTGRPASVPRRDIVRLRRALVQVLGLTCYPSPTAAAADDNHQWRVSGPPRALVMFKAIRRRMVLGRVAYAHWRVAHPNEPLSMDGTMSNLWQWWMIEKGLPNDWCVGPPPRYDTMETIETIALGCIHETRGRRNRRAHSDALDADAAEACAEAADAAAADAETAAALAPALERGRANAKLLNRPSEEWSMTVTARKRKESPSALPPAVPELPSPPPPGTAARSGDSVVPTASACTSCAFLQGAHVAETNHIKAEMNGLRAASELLGADKEKVESELARERAVSASLLHEKADLESELVRVQSDNTILRRDKAEVERELGRLGRELAQVRADSAALRRDNAAATIEKSSLQQLLDVALWELELHKSRYNTN